MFLNTIILKTLILFVLTLFPILISVAYIILSERKVMASIQRRKGPNVVGFFGLLQPFIDAVKLLSKEHIFPLKLNFIFFCLAPLLTLTIAILNWGFIPFNLTNFYYDYTFGILFLLTFSSISVYGLVLSGWSSNSKYALLGAIRTISQFISYELILTISILPIILITHTLNFTEIVLWQAETVWFIIPFWPIAYIFFISSLAETNRTPFDLPEAEAELVAGYNVEYSSVFFILFMFAEYSNILLMSALFSLFFLGGWDGFFLFINMLNLGELVFALKIIFISFLFIVIRATQPRVRFDQLLTLCWKRFFPLIFSLLLFTIFIYIFVFFVITDFFGIFFYTYVFEGLMFAYFIFLFYSSFSYFIKNLLIPIFYLLFYSLVLDCLFFLVSAIVYFFIIHFLVGLLIFFILVELFIIVIFLKEASEFNFFWCFFFLLISIIFLVLYFFEVVWFIFNFNTILFFSYLIFPFLFLWLYNLFIFYVFNLCFFKYLKNVSTLSWFLIFALITLYVVALVIFLVVGNFLLIILQYNLFNL